MARAPDPRLPKTCIIGAGSSGIAAAKVLTEYGIPFDCFEASDRVGGNWVFKNKNEMSSAYRSLHINTSRDKMAYSDFPLPREFPDYPHHAQIATYFDAYVEHFGFREHIFFNTGVKRVEQTTDGLWKIALESGEQRLYDALIVANGHHWDPRWPEPAFPGTFDGKQFHSHHYIDPTEPVDCAGKNVLVVGFGNSALDIACELGRKGVARNVFLSQRRGYWVVPKYTAGEVLDAHVEHPSKDPSWLQRSMPDGLLLWLAEQRLGADRRAAGTVWIAQARSSFAVDASGDQPGTLYSHRLGRREAEAQHSRIARPAKSPSSTTASSISTSSSGARATRFRSRSSTKGSWPHPATTLRCGSG